MSSADRSGFETPGLPWLLTAAGVVAVVAKSAVIAHGDPVVATEIVANTGVFEFAVGLLVTLAPTIALGGALLSASALLTLDRNRLLARRVGALTLVVSCVACLFFTAPVWIGAGAVVLVGECVLYGVARRHGRRGLAVANAVLVVMAALMAISQDRYWSAAELVCVRPLPASSAASPSAGPPAPREQFPPLPGSNLCDGLGESADALVGFVLSDDDSVLVLEQSRRDLYRIDAGRIAYRRVCALPDEVIFAGPLLPSRSSTTDPCPLAGAGEPGP